MDDDLDEKRAIPKDWLEYIRSTAGTARAVRWIWQEVLQGETRRWLGKMLAALFLATALQTIQPWFVSVIFDGLGAREGRFVIVGLTSVLACLIAERIVELYQATAREWILGLSWGALDRRITESFFEKSLGQHIHLSSTLSTASIDKGRQRFIDLAMMLCFEGTPAVLTLACSYAMLWYLDAIAGAITTLVIAIYLGWMLFLNWKVVAVYSPIDTELRRLNRYRLERWDKVERVATSSKETQELTHLARWFDQTIGRDRAFWLWFVKQCTYRGFSNTVGLVAVMAWGAFLVWRGDWSVGLLYPLYSWSTRVSENIWRIGHIEHQLNWNMPSVLAMIDALSIPPDVTDRDDATVLPDDAPISVAFSNVTHTYPIEADQEARRNGKGATPVLRNVHFTIGPGEKVALIGPSGAGKTTVMRLLLRYMDPDTGNIFVNERKLSDIKRASWTRAIGYIPQQAQVFDGTIRYNLAYAVPAPMQQLLTDDDIWQLMRLLKIDFGERLTHGLETLVGRNGIKLSGGQAQRLMIGAAAIKRPRFMIIDEATSHLDSTTERAVQDGLAAILRDGVSALVVAHRLSTVRNLCDKFVVLRNPEEVPPDGSQVEAIACSFEELYASSPTFRQLADDQSITINTP